MKKIKDIFDSSSDKIPIRFVIVPSLVFKIDAVEEKSFLETPAESIKIKIKFEDDTQVKFVNRIFDKASVYL